MIETPPGYLHLSVLSDGYAIKSLREVRKGPETLALLAIKCGKMALCAQERDPHMIDVALKEGLSLEIGVALIEKDRYEPGNDKEAFLNLVSLEQFNNSRSHLQARSLSKGDRLTISSERETESMRGGHYPTVFESASATFSRDPNGFYIPALLKSTKVPNSTKPPVDTVLELSDLVSYEKLEQHSLDVSYQIQKDDVMVPLRSLHGVAKDMGKSINADSATLTVALRIFDDQEHIIAETV